MNVDQRAGAEILIKQRKQLDAFVSDVSPKISRALVKAQNVLAAYEEGCSGIGLPPGLSRDLNAVIKTLERSEQWARTAFSIRTTELANLATALSSPSIEPADP